MPPPDSGPPTRPRVDLAWAQTQAKNDMEATVHLQQAERVAPESIKYRTIAGELVRELLRRSRNPALP
jgi:hypothetical protein